MGILEVNLVISYRYSKSPHSQFKPCSVIKRIRSYAAGTPLYVLGTKPIFVLPKTHQFHGKSRKNDILVCLPHTKFQ